MPARHVSNSTRAVKEEWRPIPDGGGYQASSFGRIRGILGTGRILKPSLLSNGRLYVTVCRKFQSVHRLIARTFIGPCPAGLVVNHIDANPRNNRADNLEYITQEENVRHAMRMGRFDRPSKLSPEQIEQAKAMVAGGMSRREVATRFGVSHGTINFAVRGLTWKAYFAARRSSKIADERMVCGCTFDSAPGLQNPSIPPQTGANASKTAHSPLTGQEQGGQVSERLKAGHAPTSQPNAQQSNGLYAGDGADSTPSDGGIACNPSPRSPK